MLLLAPYAIDSDTSEANMQEDEWRITTSNGTITYKGDHFNGTINMEIPGMGPAKQKITGQRIGNCKK
jgi:hypothetical protein